MSAIARMPMLHAQRPLALVHRGHRLSFFSTSCLQSPQTKNALRIPKHVTSRWTPPTASAPGFQSCIRSRVLAQSRFMSQTPGRQAERMTNLEAGIKEIKRAHSRTFLAIWIIVGINTAVFCAWQYARSTDNRLVSAILQAQFMTSNLHMRLKQYFSLVGAAFSHISPGHFAFNMLALFSMGSLLVYMPGMRATHIVAITLTSGVLGNIAQLSSHPATDRLSLGASGAVMGLAAVATCYAPWTPMNFMFIPISIPLWITTVGYALFDSYYIGSETSRIGHAAHVGGGLAGVAYYMVFLRKYGALMRLLPKL